MNCIYFRGKVVDRSKNLRGLISYGHRHGVRSVTITACGEGATVTVWFANSANTTVKFASASVASDFFKKRQPKWGGTIEGSGYAI